MKLYAQADFDNNAAEKKRAARHALLCALPFLAIAAAAFVVRIQWLCMAACILCGAVAILLFDWEIAPAIHYGRFLREIHSGLTRKTLGTLVRVSEDLVYQDNVYSREIIINIYEDMDEEGERRFLLECSKEIPREWIGKDIVVTSHGSFLLEAEIAGGEAA